jgi:hypothetical protein
MTNELRKGSNKQMNEERKLIKDLKISKMNEKFCKETENLKKERNVANFNKPK